MLNQKLNFIFWGTPDVASDTLEILKEKGFLPSLIVTMPDKPSGRKMIITPPPVKTWAINNNIPYIQPENLNQREIWDVLRTLGKSDGDEQRKFSAENFRGDQNIPDFSLVVAYGKIISQEIIDLPKFGSINIHYSLLPKYRGASPVESAILNGDTKTGATIQKMAFKLDSGDILNQESIDILPDETTPELRSRLIQLGASLLIKTISDILSEKIISIPQDESQATFCKKIKKEDGLIDLTENALKNYNKYRAYFAWPRVYFFEKDKRQIITKASLKDGKFIIEKIIEEGGKEKSYKSN